MHPVVGLTGLPGAGKSAAAAALAELGAHVIDVDRRGHELLAESELQRRIADAFGAEALAPDGTVDRRKLGGLVFADPAQLAELERLLHPELARRVRLEAERERGRRPVVIDAALLCRLGLDEICDRVVLVEAPRAERLRRCAARGWDAAELERRDASQSRECEIAREKADYTAVNGGNMGEFKVYLHRIWKEIEHGSEEKSRQAQN